MITYFFFKFIVLLIILIVLFALSFKILNVTPNCITTIIAYVVFIHIAYIFLLPLVSGSFSIIVFMPHNTLCNVTFENCCQSLP